MEVIVLELKELPSRKYKVATMGVYKALINVVITLIIGRWEKVPLAYLNEERCRGIGSINLMDYAIHMYIELSFFYMYI